MYRNVSKSWLIGILILLPFQHRIADNVISWNNQISTFIQYLDEITIVVFLPLTIIEFYRKKEAFDLAYLIVLLPLVALSISGFMSGVLNGNSIFITLLGTFDYIKNFLVIFIYTAFFREVNELKKIFRLLLSVTVIVGIVALIQEIWALVAHYYLARDIYDSRLYLLEMIPQDRRIFESYWRLGIYRASSLLFHPNELGLYSLLMLSIYLYTTKKINPAIFLSIFSGIFVSVSRMIYTAFLLLSTIQIFRGKRWFIIPSGAIAVLLFFMSFLPDNMWKWENQEWIFRAYTKDKAIEIWRDNFFLGVGPGMFGGVVSIIYNSPIYGEYNFSQKWFEFMKPFRSLDQFWPQALAEMGIIGAIFFVCLLVALFIFFTIFKKRASTGERKVLFTALTVVTIFIFIYTLGSGLNNTAFLFTYSALAGIGLSCENSSC